MYQDIRTGTYDSSLGNLTAKDQKHKSENPKMEVDIEAANGILNPGLDDVEPIVPSAGKNEPKRSKKGKAKAKVAGVCLSTKSEGTPVRQPRPFVAGAPEDPS